MIFAVNSTAEFRLKPLWLQIEHQRLATTTAAVIQPARRLHSLQSRDSRLGFEASNQYYYVPVDLAEKVINCHDLLTRWLPAQRGGA